MTQLSEFRFFVEFIARITNQQVSSKFDEKYGWVEFYLTQKPCKYRIQFLEGKFDHADVFKYSNTEEMYKHRRTYLNAYEFLADI